MCLTDIFGHGTECPKESANDTIVLKEGSTSMTDASVATISSLIPIRDPLYELSTDPETEAALTDFDLLVAQQAVQPIDWDSVDESDLIARFKQKRPFSSPVGKTSPTYCASPQPPPPPDFDLFPPIVDSFGDPTVRSISPPLPPPPPPGRSDPIDDANPSAVTLAPSSTSSDQPTSTSLPASDSLKRVESRPIPSRVAYSLRGHFDAVRSAVFHPTNKNFLFTSSDDCTLKTWNLTRSSQAKGSSSILDVEPVHTYRGHTTPILALVALPALQLDSSPFLLYSADLSGCIRSWRHSPALDSCDTFDPNLIGPCLVGHSDAVWSLDLKDSVDCLLSSSSDGTARLWSLPPAASKTPVSPRATFPLSTLMSSNLSSNHQPLPVCARRLIDDDKFVVGFTSGQLGLFDLETGQLISSYLSSPPSDDNDPLNEFTTQPNQQTEKTTSYCRRQRSVIDIIVPRQSSIVVVAFEDDVHWLDPRQPRWSSSIAALTSVGGPLTALAVDSSGSTLATAGYNSPLRLWSQARCVKAFSSSQSNLHSLVTSLTFQGNEEGNLLAVGGSTGIVSVLGAAGG